MALLNYGRTLGLAYKHDYKQWNDEMYRQEQLNAAKKAQDQQKSMWISEQLKLGKTYTKFDSDQLRQFSNERFKKVGKILQTEGWETNPLALAEIAQVREELLDNEHTQRSARVYESYQRKLKDMTNPELMQDEDARNEIIKSSNAFKNYDKYGNTMGIEGGPVEEYSYTTPSIFDVNEAFNEQSKFVGKRNVISDQGGLLVNSEVFANMDEVVGSLISGKKGAQFQRAHQKYLAAGGPNKDIRSWARKNLEMRVNLDKTAQPLPGYGRSPGGDKEGKAANDHFDMWVRTGLTKNSEKVRAGEKFATLSVKGVEKFIPNATPIGNDGKGQMTIPSNVDPFVMNAQGERRNIGNINGSTKQVISYNTIKTVNIAGEINHYAEVETLIDVADLESSSLYNDPWYASGSVEEAFKNQIRPYVVNGKTVEDKMIVKINVPVDFSPQRQADYDMQYNTTEGANIVQRQAQERSMAIQNLANTHPPGIYETDVFGTPLKVQVNKDKTVKVVY